ncbi:MAG TPA: glycosyltransferase family 2 protein [Chloroflexi bacterium]|nr:glycosyltransferase family 2 protein [Chloroflexota bacterium]HAL27958.1 glycosyltransferase family 2 protein [Chloroflexota bacterium]
MPPVTEHLSGLSFFFPARDEELNIEPMVARALAVLPMYADWVEVTIVDDGSSDRTGAIADALARADPRVKVLHHRPGRGYGGAVRAGLMSATQPFVFFTDGDQQFDVADFDKLIGALGPGVDAVIGYRLQLAYPWRHLVVSGVYNRVIRLLFSGGWRDVDCAFKLFRADVFARVPLNRVHSNGAFFSPELLITLRANGIVMREVGIPHHPRVHHEPKGTSPEAIVKAIRDLLLLRLSLWLRPR